jgi:hypothetical protein
MWQKSNLQVMATLMDPVAHTALAIATTLNR